MCYNRQPPKPPTNDRAPRNPQTRGIRAARLKSSAINGDQLGYTLLHHNESPGDYLRVQQLTLIRGATQFHGWLEGVPADAAETFPGMMTRWSRLRLPIEAVTPHRYYRTLRSRWYEAGRNPRTCRVSTFARASVAALVRAQLTSRLGFPTDWSAR